VVISAAQFELREASIEDADGIAALFRDADPRADFGSVGFSRVWRWLHFENPASMTYALVARDEHQRIVGHLGLMPLRFVVHGGSRVAGAACQLVIAPEFRHTPLFRSIELRLLQGYPQRDFAFVLALVNRPRVLPLHLAFGFQELGQLHVYARALRADRVIEQVGAPRVAAAAGPALRALNPLLRRSWYRRPAGIRVTQLTEFDDSVRPLMASFGDGLVAERDEHVLRWRFVDAPGRGYRIFGAFEGTRLVGYVVVRAMPMRALTGLAIVDIVFDPRRQDIGLALLGEALDVAIQENVDLAAALFNPTDPRLGPFRRAGYVRTGERFTLLMHQPTRGPQGLDLASFRDWHVGWFEHDNV
jgi:hypothetical protein